MKEKIRKILKKEIIKHKNIASVISIIYFIIGTMKMNIGNFYKNIIRNLKRFFSAREKSLLELVREKKKTNRQIREILKKKSDPIWIPSIGSFLKILVAVLTFWFIVHPQYFFLWFLAPIFNFVNIFFNISSFSLFNIIINNIPSFQLPLLAIGHNHYQNLIMIHAGIGAVLIGLAFFVAQSLTDKNDPERGKVLLYKSYFFPLLTAEILVFCLFLWGEVNILSVIPVLIVAGLTILSLARVILILIKEYEMEKSKKAMFFKVVKEGFVKILDREITKRFGNNYLFEKFKESKRIEISPFGPISKKEYFPIKSGRSGVFSDLFFSKLEKFISELKPRVIKGKEISKDFDTSTTKESLLEPQREPICYLVPLFYSEIKNGDTLFWIKKNLLERNSGNEKAKFIKKIENLGRGVFDIKDIDNPEEEAGSEFTKLKDRCFAAISEKRTGELKKIIRLYIELEKEFFNYIELYGGGFSQKQAEKERTSFIERLKPVEWLSRDIGEIFERGIQSKDIDIIREVAYLPIVLARHAIDHKDHLIFQEFIYFPRLLYSYAFEEKKNGNDKLADFMFDRTWRYIKELSDFHLEPKIKESSFGEEDFKGFAVYLLRIFQSLLKSSLDKRDIVNFRKFLSISQKLFKHLGDSFYTRRLDGNKSKEIFGYLDNKRKQMYFGLVSWITYLLEKDKHNRLLKEFYSVTKGALPFKIEDFTKIFTDSHSFEAERFWNWDDWEMQEKEEGEVHSIRILEKLEKFYAIQSLLILETKTADEVNKINLPPSRDLAYLAGGTRDLMRILDNITTNPDNWNFVLSDKATKRVDEFKQLLSKTKDAQEQNELELKRKGDISQKKIQEFKNDVVEGFYESVALRDIFRHYKLLKDHTKEIIKDKQDRFGINIVDDKAMFFEDWHVHYGDWGKGYGRDLALGENSHLLDEISKNCKEIAQENFDTILGKIESPKDIIIFATNVALWRFFENPEKFKSSWHKDVEQLKVKAFKGWYEFNGQSIPVFETYHQKIDKQILILNKSKLGQFIQLSPLDEGEDEKFLKDIFYMNIQAFSDNPELIEKFIKKPPEWLQNIGEKKEQREHLQERVLMHIFERFKYNKVEDFEGYKLFLKE